MARPKIEGETQAASRTEILEALSPYITNGPSGLKVTIGTSNVTLTREGRRFVAERNAPIDSLIDAAVELTGPLTEKELLDVMKNYEGRGITMKVNNETVFFTRESHIETFTMPKDKSGNAGMRQVRMRERVIASSLDAPVVHITRVLDEMALGGEVFE